MFSLPTSQELGCYKTFAENITVSSLQNYETLVNAKKTLLVEMLENPPEKHKQHWEAVRFSMESIKEAPNRLKQVLFFNSYEDAISSLCYNDLFKRFLEICHYDVAYLEKPGKKVAANRPEVPYEDILLIEGDQVDTLQQKVKRGWDESGDRDMLDKYFYRQYIHIDHPLEPSVFTHYYSKSHPAGRDVFFNIVSEKNSNVADVQAEDLANATVLDVARCKGFQLQTILFLRDALGLQHSQDVETTVPREKVVALNEWAVETRDDINTAFGVRDSSKKTEASLANTVMLLNKVFRVWSGMTLKAIQKDSSSKTPLLYRLGPKDENRVPFWDLVREPQGVEELGFYP